MELYIAPRYSIKYGLMWNWLYSICFMLFGACIVACNDTRVRHQPNAADSCAILQPLFSLKPAPKEWEWKAVHPGEVHVPVKAYINQQPPRANGQRQKLYTVKLGAFDSTGNSIYLKVTQYLSAFYQIEVDTLPSIALNTLNDMPSRQNDFGLQLNSLYILDSVLYPSKPADAFALIAFSLYDLYPNDNWNYVFGQATLNKGTGVWSMARLGDYSESAAGYKQVLYRTMKVAAHETGHMLGITHCVKYQCTMNGSNSLQESDGQPEWLCWECLAKVCWNRNITAAQHLKSLYTFHLRYTQDADCIQHYSEALTLLNPK